MPAPARDLVFISYSRKDVDWLERLRTFLKPYTRQGTLEVWVDRERLETGDYWRPEIERALDRTCVGVLLVSPYFLASDFIMENEVPVLLTASQKGDLKLAPILLSKCAYETIPLEEVQFAFGPRPPLDDLKVPKRNAALTEVTKKIVKLVTAADTRPPAAPSLLGPTAPARAAPIELIPTDRVGDLHGVPPLPPHHLPRTEDIARLKRALLDRAAVGITAAADKLGLHGQGGIGKTVLASALARDEAVRRAFPDGVYWVTVGQQPDVLRLQAELVREISGAAAEFTDTGEGSRALGKAFANRNALLVVDDVWDAGHARAFDVAGEGARLLLTTRDSAVLTAVGATDEPIERLSEEAALALLAEWSGTRAER
ncbi:MAG: NB-ARC domain-containing protein, partial [Longimicrobiaceae bacterium]